MHLVPSLSDAVPQPAAVFRVEGLLTTRTSLHAALWLASSDPEPAGRLLRVARLGLSLAPGLSEPWSALRGLSRDRIEVLGARYGAQLVAGLTPLGEDVVNRARAARLRVVLLSAMPAPFVAPLARHLRAELVANALAYRGERATGALLAPVIEAEPAGGARERLLSSGVELEASTAYGAQASDQEWLAHARRPCAVAPDRALSRAAERWGWPVVRP